MADKESGSIGPGSAKSSESAAAPQPPDQWSEAEIKTAQLDCDRRLSGLHIVFERLDPIREGACGLPYPIKLNGFDNGEAPGLKFTPAPTISCRLAEALKHWYDDAVQPKAKAHLNASVIQIVDLSAYSCRTRYDIPSQRISAHAYANAIDIAEFVTAKGEHVSVLDGWNSKNEHEAFLHEIHDGACAIFGTTLGPEANEAHKNHFHLDMIERRRPLCDFTPAQLRAREEAKKLPVVPASAEAKVPLAADIAPATKRTDSPISPAPATIPLNIKPEAENAVQPAVRRGHRRRRHSHRFFRS